MHLSKYTTGRNTSLVTLSDLYNKGNLKTFADLQTEYNLPQTEAFTYMRISHFLKTSKIASVVKIPEQLHNFYTCTRYPKYGISTMYSVTPSDNRPYSQLTSLSKLVEELSVTINVIMNFQTHLHSLPLLQPL